MIRIGTLGAALITPRALIYPCIDEPRAYISAIAARDRSRAEDLAKYAGIPRVLDSYQEVIDCEKVDAVYNPLLITAHHEWTIKALRAGKHVLCEKSFASNEQEAVEMAAVAEETGLVLMDAFHYRYHPVFIRAREIYTSGVLGRIQKIDACFHIPVTDPDSIRMKYETGGGVTMDIGCYPISWVRHITGLEPESIEAKAETGPPHVDVFLTTEMQLPGGIVARTSGDMRKNTAFRADLRVKGDRGELLVTNPLVPQNGHQIELTIDNHRTIETCDRRSTYGYQLDAFLDAIEKGTPLYTDPDDAVKQMHVIDACYRSAGLPIRGLDDV